MIKNLSSKGFQEQSAKVDHGPASFPPGAQPLNSSISGNSVQKMHKKTNY
jgi:hypothetical protein